MGVFLTDGSRVTKTTVPKTAVGDPEVVLTADLYKSQKYGVADNDSAPEGSKKTLLARSGAKFRQSELDAMFPAATVSSISPAGGAAAGGTVVTINGTNLDGVTSVTFDGTAGTALQVLSDKQVQVTSPAKAAGARPVVVVDDSGDTAAGNFTYA